MRAGRVEEAGALAKDIKHRSKTRFMKIDGKTGAKDMWTAVRQLTGHQHQQPPVVDGVTAESLNDHYPAISTDSTYSQPPRKQPASSTELQYISEWCMFKLLDNLYHTATGLLDSMVSPTGSSSLLQTHLPALQPITVHLHSPPAVETGLHPTNSKSFSSHATRRLPPHLHHTSPYQSHGEVSSPSLPLPCLPVPSPNPVIFQSICLPSNRFSSSCYNLPPPHCHQHAPLQSLCHRHIPRLQQGV